LIICDAMVSSLMRSLSSLDLLLV